MGHLVYIVNGTRRFISPLTEAEFVESCVEYGDDFVLVGYVG